MSNLMIKNKIKLSDIFELNQLHCKIKDRKKVENILNSFIEGGVNRLQVITDFDFTVTKQHRGNSEEKVLSSFGILNACKSIPKSFLEAENELCQKYYPIEIDPKIPKEEKITYMIEWWTQTSNLLKGFALDAAEIDEVTLSKCKDSLRDKTPELFSKLNELDIPCLVFSAGLGDCVVSLLKNANVMYPNMKIISNFLRYKNGLLDGLQDPIIHVFNKNEAALKGTEYYDLVHNKDHIILMGDSLGDCSMADGLPLQTVVLKIGFLYNSIDENLPKYQEFFDIVLIDDQTMDVPQSIVNLVANEN